MTSTTSTRRCRPWQGRVAIGVGGLLISGVALTIGYVVLPSSTSGPAAAPTSGAGSVRGAPGAAVATAVSTLPASRLRAGMVVDFHGRRWSVLRVNPVSTRPGILLELREAGTPGFHILYVDPSSPITVVGRA